MNGTVTLEVALRAADVGSSDEVMVPPVQMDRHRFGAAFRPTAAMSAMVAGMVGCGLDLATISCPNAERIADHTGLGLAQHALLCSHRDVDDVVAAIEKVSRQAYHLVAVSAG